MKIEDKAVYDKQYRERNKKQIVEYKSEWYKNNKERILKARAIWFQGHKEESCTYHIKYRKRIKLEVLSHYGGSPPRCACCGEVFIEFLCIDHINGGGAVHRRKLKKWGVHFYAWLRKNKFPEGFRVLCHNCNMSIGAYGYCPHDIVDKKT